MIFVIMPIGFTMNIEVVFWDEKLQMVITQLIKYSSGLKVSDILAMYNFDSNTNVGIYSVKVSPDTLIAPSDRIEIYQPLRIDPKKARMNRSNRG